MKVAPLGLSREDIRRELDRMRQPVSVAIDRAKNGFNIGAIIRTAHSFLVREIVLIGSEPWYERAAMGMQRYEHILELPDEAAFLERAAEQGSKIVAFEKEEGRCCLWDAELPDDSILVFGSEDAGVSRAILDRAHEVVSIPMYGINHSYPVAIAAGIAMAEWTRRRWRGKP